jgi:acetolactate synthase-1/2/3 large subunit
MTTSVADVMADGLARAGASRVFAVDRGDEDGLLEAVGRRGLSVVRVSRAAVACVMAGVSGASDGAPGAAVIGEAPGDASDGLAYAWPDRLPVIVITSGVSAAGGLAAVTKATLAVAPGSAAQRIAHACELAMTEPWGPVHLDVPPAVAAAAAPPVAASCRPAPLPAPGPGALDAALRLLDAAERPLVVVGLLCRSEADGAWVRAFAEARPAPVLVTPKARGVLPDPHPLVIGTLGAGAAERALLESADLVVAVGVDPIEVDPSPWPAETAVLQLTPAAPEAHGPDRVSVVGDIGLILEELAPRLRDRRFAEWDVARLHALKQAAAAPPADAPRLAAYRVVEAARRLTPAGTIAVFEGGDVWPFAARAWQAVAPGECLIPVGPATEGFAVAAATAAQLARPQWRVVCFTDPGAIGTARDQVETLAVLGRPVLIVVLGASGSFAPPAGLRAFAAASIATFTTVFESALACGRPALVTVGAASSQ